MIVALTTKDIHSIPTELIPVDPKIGVRPMDNFTWLTYFFFSSQGLIYYAFRIMFSFYGYKVFWTGLFSEKEKSIFFMVKRICCYFNKSNVSV